MRALFLISFLLSAAAAHGANNVRSIHTAVGVLYLPDDGKETHPGVVVYHGSEGGGRAYNQLDAQYLAMHGFAALAHCYYQCLNSFEDIADPKVEFIDLPIEKPYAAFTWLKQSKFTQGHKVGLLGTSKGAELTFLIAAITAQENMTMPDAIAAHAVSDSAEIGFSWNWQSRKCYWGADGKNWNRACGLPPTSTHEGFIQAGKTCYQTPAQPRSSYTYHSWTWKGTHDLIRTHQQIPLELYSGPIFFTHGELDPLWCASKATGMRDRLLKAGRPAEFHLFAGEGHNFRDSAEEKRMNLLLDFFRRTLN
jgi:dienelactone hydrolase